MIAENNYKVYKHTAPNGKVYIGITCQDPHKRWGYGCSYKKQRYFSTAIEKYGWDNIAHEILYENLSQKEAEDKEIELIAKYKSNNREFGYNIANGGKSRGMVSEETRELISKVQKGRKQRPETIQKRANSNRGKHRSEETKRKISEANKGKKPTEYTLLKLREANTGRKPSEETRKKLSESIKKSWTEERKKEMAKRVSGKNNHNYGRKFTKEEIENLQFKNRGANSVLSKRVGQFDKEGNIIKIYGSCREAGRDGFKQSGVSAVCRREKHTYKGFVWKYIGEENGICKI
jgi:group I intron endonuclease